MAEWSNAPVLKTDEGESPPRVRIPVPPPYKIIKQLFIFNYIVYDQYPDTSTDTLCRSNQERHFYSRDNFKINGAAALAEWRQLLSA